MYFSFQTKNIQLGGGGGGGNDLAVVKITTYGGTFEGEGGNAPQPQ